ncbi:helix-turn-helix domain-containing protein [Chitinophagaceae bacterium LB-8]|jgi:helix-turn-helix protein|uniref:Helix-turn-helix domain-containing protein n=1 Tax=Paraflavisolibacter caeni TaxID=2982496 RepID=A0A9X2XNQ2_9BACT|nr:helix-turn-helix domain-containing protein [Paraflavisolibacter caeni]MCU7549328.1 helix-turn-helix domain-containing protein [Paraflavisolibacter caeni]
MAVEILTRHDLMLFKEDLISELKQIFSKEQAAQKKWLKSDEVRRLLKVSPGTLQTLRINGTLQYTKIGGIIYYDYDHIQSLLNKPKR